MVQLLLKTPVIYSPWIGFFLCAAVGILTNHWFEPGVMFWKRLLLVSIICLFLTKSFDVLLKNTRLKRKLDVFVLRYLYHYEAWFCGVLYHGFIWIWLAAIAVAGLHHEYYYSFFPDNEIGLHIPHQGVASSLRLRLIKTPVFWKNEEEKRRPFGNESSTSFIASVISAKTHGEWQSFTGKVYVSVHGDASFLHIGDVICVTGKLRRPDHVNNPNERDRAKLFRFQRILSRLDVESINDVEVIPLSKQSLLMKVMRELERIRLRSATIVRGRLSERNAAVALGMTLGFRNEVDDETRDTFRRTGTLHLLAISGLHVMLVVGALAFILRIIGFHEEIVCVVTIFFVLIYMGMTEMRPPVVRASILVIILCVSYILSLETIILDSLAIAALILLALNPCDLFQPGAQLSFLATGTFLWAESLTILIKSNANIARYKRIKRIKRRLKKRQPVPPKPPLFPDSYLYQFVILPRCVLMIRLLKGKVPALFKSGAVIWAVGAPLVLSITNWFTPVAIIANPLIWLPAMIALVLAFSLEFVGLCADFWLFSYLLSPFLDMLTYITDKGFDLFLGTLEYIEGQNVGSWRLPAPPIWTLWLFYLPLIFWSVFPHLRPLKRWVAILLILWGGMVYCEWATRIHFERAHNSLSVDVFYVGHGAAILGRFSDGRTFLYDCGSLENATRSAEIVAHNIWNSGRLKVDVVVISHADYDHYGGITELLRMIEIENVCVSPSMFKKENESVASLHKSLEEADINIIELSGGDSLDLLGFPELTILHPIRENNKETSAESNANSLVLAVEHLDRIMIFPGDLDAPDAAFLETPPLKTDFVLAPHHGGHSEQAELFYEWADPDYVGISGGKFLRNYDAEDLLRHDGRAVAHTYDDGDIQIQIEPNPEEPTGRGLFYISTFKTKRSSKNGSF